MMDGGLSEEETAEIFRRRYYVSEEKIDLLLETCRNQRFLTSVPAENTAGVYIGIPFCPTRCLYCSFASNQASGEAMERYLQALLTEIEAVGAKFRSLGIVPESLYVGGGTPTSLSVFALERLLSCAVESFDLSEVREFCVEAGQTGYDHRGETVCNETLWSGSGQRKSSVHERRDTQSDRPFAYGGGNLPRF